MNLDTITCSDALEYAKTLPDECVDCVVTSPPYNMRANVDDTKAGGGTNWKVSDLLTNGYETHGDDMPYAEYVQWQREILTACMRVLKPTGAIFYNHKWRIQNGLIETRSAIVEGFPVRQLITWDRGSGNNHEGSYFVPQAEVIYLITKRNFRVQREAVAYGDVWHIPFETNTPHPAPFPVELAYRCIQGGCAIDGIVFDPFMGWGTTAVAARMLGRHYIGCDLSQHYVDMAHERLKHNDKHELKAALQGKPVTTPMW